MPGRSNQCGCHFIGNIECIDQDVLIAFQPNGIFDQEFCEFIESRVVHRRLSFHQPDTMQLRPFWCKTRQSARYNATTISSEGNSGIEFCRECAIKTVAKRK